MLLAPDPGCIRELVESSFEFAREPKAAMEAAPVIKNSGESQDLFLLYADDDSRIWRA